METLYRKVAVSERNPTNEGNYNTSRGFLSYSKVFGWFTFQNYTTPNPEYWLEEIPDNFPQIEKLEAEKKELLEALENTNYLIKSIKNDCSDSDLHEYYDVCVKIESENHSLIQKHKS